MTINPSAEHYVISSPLAGQLVDKGQALVNAKLVRRLEWNGNKEGTKEDIVLTDENGFFSFDVFELDMSMRGLEQFVAHTSIYLLEEKKEEKMLWYNPKQSQGLFHELGKKVDGLICDINQDEIITQKTNGAKSKVVTICRWDDMPEYIESFDI